MSSKVSFSTVEVIEIIPHTKSNSSSNRRYKISIDEYEEQHQQHRRHNMTEEEQQPFTTTHRNSPQYRNWDPLASVSCRDQALQSPKRRLSIEKDRCDIVYKNFEQSQQHGSSSRRRRHASHTCRMAMSITSSTTSPSLFHLWSSDKG